MYLYELSKEDIPLAAEEVMALVEDEGTVDRNLFLTDGFNSSVKRLAYTRAVYKVLFSCSTSSLKKKCWTYNWADSYKKSFALRIHSSKFSEESFAGLIWNSLKTSGKKPKVDLKKPGVEYHILFGKKVHVCVKLVEIDTQFEDRKAHKRATLHPTAMHPKLARAMVNLTGAGKKSIVHDPFCGSGGILIEAGLMGVPSRGYDNDLKVLTKCRKNLAGMNSTNYKLNHGNSLKISRPMSFIASDLPFGLNTKSLTKNFFDSAFEMIGKTLRVRAVLGLPASLKYKPLLVENGLEEVFSTTVYLHKNLSKRILVLEPSA